MKKNSLCVCLHRGQKNIHFCEIVYKGLLGFEHPRTIAYRTWRIQPMGFEHRRIQPIRFRGSIAISQSEFSNVENRSEGVFRHGDFTQWGFKPRRIQPIRFQGHIVISQSDISNMENGSERGFRHGDFTQ